MENVGFAALQIIPSMKGFDSKLTAGTSGPMSRAGILGGRSFGDSAGRSMTASITSHAKRAAFLGAAAFSAVGIAAFKLGKDSIAEARESQKVGALTDAVIKSTGKSAGLTADQVGKMAGRLSLLTGVDDEVIQRGENMLLTFKGVKDYVGGQYIGTFSEATAVSLDMAAAMAGGKGGDLDLKASSILVGKALNDPIKGLTALTRVGVTFNDEQKKQIEGFVKHNDLASAQGVILKELQSEFGGAAAAQATMGEKVKTAWGNIEEQLGTALLPLVDKAEKAFLNKGVPAIEGWVDAFEKKGVPALKHFGRWVTTDGVDKLEDFYHQAKPVAEDVLPAIFDLLGASKPILKTSAHLVGDLADAFTKIPRWAQVTIAGGLLAGKAGGFKLAGSLFGKGGIGSIASRSAPLPVIVMNEGFGPGVGGRGSKRTAASTYVEDGNEDRRRRDSAKRTGAALVAGVIGDELTGGKISEILSHPLRELRAEFTYPFTYGEGGAFKGLNQSQDFLLKRAHQTGALYRGGSITLQDRQLPGLATFPQIKQPPVVIPKVSTKEIDTANKKLAAFNDAMGAVNDKDMRPDLGIPRLAQTAKALGEFISKEIDAGKPISININTSSIQRAISQADTLNAKLRAAADTSRGLDNGVTFQHGGQSVDDRVQAHFGSR